MKRSLLLLSAFCLFFLTLASAQAQVGIYGMFSADHYSGLGVGSGTASNGSGGITPIGGTFGFYDDVLHAGPVHLGYDARLKIDNSANSTSYGNKLLGGFVGARLDGNLIVLPFRPYVQAEVGGVGTNNGTSSDRQGAFAYQVQFGGDFTVLPHIGVRLEYGAGQAETTGSNHTLQSFGAGLVVRL